MAVFYITGCSEGNFPKREKMITKVKKFQRAYYCGDWRRADELFDQIWKIYKRKAGRTYARMYPEHYAQYGEEMLEKAEKVLYQELLHYPFRKESLSTFISRWIIWVGEKFIGPHGDEAA